MMLLLLSCTWLQADFDSMMICPKSYLIKGYIIVVDIHVNYYDDNVKSNVDKNNSKGQTYNLKAFAQSEI